MELQAAGANGFVLKESPEQSVNSRYSFDALQSFGRQITVCLSNSYLISVWALINEVNNSFEINSLPKYSRSIDLQTQLNDTQFGLLKKLINSELDAIFAILQTNNINKYKIAMLMQFKILEHLIKFFFKNSVSGHIDEFKDNEKIDLFDPKQAIIKKSKDMIKRKTITSEELKVLNSTVNKILNISVNKLKIIDCTILADLIKLKIYRNGYIHPEYLDNPIDVVPGDILTWMISINSILMRI